MARRTRADVRRELDELVQDVNRLGVGATPLVIECRRRGDFNEFRPAGVHYENPATRTGLVIVYDGDDVPQELIDKVMPKTGHTPLIITFGPENVEPPLNDPDDLD